MQVVLLHFKNVEYVLSAGLVDPDNVGNLEDQLDTLLSTLGLMQFNGLHYLG